MGVQGCGVQGLGAGSWVVGFGCRVQGAGWMLAGCGLPAHWTVSGWWAPAWSHALLPRRVGLRGSPLVAARPCGGPFDMDQQSVCTMHPLCCRWCAPR